MNGKLWLARIGALAVTWATLLVLPACGGTPPLREGLEEGLATTEGAVAVRVVNDLAPAQAVTVVAVPEQGDEVVLGTVAAGETAGLTLRPGPSPVRLVARTAAGAEVIRSEPIVASRRGTAAWTLATNRVTFTPMEP